MESVSSQLSGEVTREQDPAPATGRNEDQTRERVPGSDLVGIDELLDQIHGTASSVLQFTHNWEEIDKHYTTIESLLKERTLEVELKERSVTERIKDLEKKEERLKEVEEREMKIGLLETSMTLRSEENDVKHYLVSSVMRLVCETANEEAVKDIEEKGKEVERLSKCNEDKSCELEKAVKEFELKQQEWIESRSKEAEIVKESLKKLEVREKELGLTDEAIKEKLTELEKKEEIFESREKELGLLDEAIKEKVTELKKKEEIFEVEQKVKAEEMALKSKGKLAELEKKEKIFEVKLKAKAEEMDVKEKKLEERVRELGLLDEAIKEKVTELKKKEEIFEAEQKAKAEEMELKSKEKLAELEKKEKIFEVKLKAKAEEMDVKERKLEERVRELELNHRELQERSIKAETCKRSREQFMAEKGSEADSLIPPAKKHKPDSHVDAVSASASSPEHINYAVKEETDEEPAQIHIADSEFHDFKKTMSSFMVDKIWALYDPKDNMPRFYAKIKRINKSRSCLEVTWLEPRDEESVPVACGRFTYGRSATISHLAFSHELQPIIHFRNIAVNPKEGETWALFRDWSQSWDTNPGQHKPPYRYDLVEVILGFEDHKGVGVSYLGKVQGFVSVFKQAVQHGVLKLVITPEEMHRFSHRVPSVRLNGEEKEGVPVGSFELDPAAVPSYILLGETEPVIEVADGSTKDVPIVIS